MSHTCHAADCSREIKPEMLMCSIHWNKVPRPVQLQVWATYRKGQCDDWQPSAAYCDAAKSAVVAVAKAEGKELPADHPNLRLYDLIRPKVEMLGWGLF